MIAEFELFEDVKFRIEDDGEWSFDDDVPENVREICKANSLGIVIETPHAPDPLRHLQQLAEDLDATLLKFEWDPPPTELDDERITF